MSTRAIFTLQTALHRGSLEVFKCAYTKYLYKQVFLFQFISDYDVEKPERHNKIRLVLIPSKLLSHSLSLCLAPSSLLTQIKSVVPVDLYPEFIHLCVPFGVRVPQHLTLHIHYFLALLFRVFRHLRNVPSSVAKHWLSSG